MGGLSSNQMSGEQPNKSQFFFSAMSALQRRGEANDRQDDTVEEDLVAIENEDMIHSLSQAVIDDMGVVPHHTRRH